MLSFKNCATAMPLKWIRKFIFFYYNGKITVLLLKKKNTLDEEPKAEKQRKYQ
jgi:hypothetical protein